MGESTEKEGLLRVLNIDVEGQVPTENGQWRSGCSEEAPFPELSFVKEPVSTIHGGIQESTTPQVILPVEEDQCFLPEVRSNDESVEPQTESKYITSESLGCEPNNQVLEDTQGEQIQMRTGMTISRFLKPPVRIICLRVKAWKIIFVLVLMIQTMNSLKMRQR